MKLLNVCMYRYELKQTIIIITIINKISSMLFFHTIFFNNFCSFLVNFNDFWVEHIQFPFKNIFYCYFYKKKMLKDHFQNTY